MLRFPARTADERVVSLSGRRAVIENL